jgi:hypothetical protein
MKLKLDEINPKLETVILFLDALWVIPDEKIFDIKSYLPETYNASFENYVKKQRLKHFYFKCNIDSLDNVHKIVFFFISQAEEI